MDNKEYYNTCEKCGRPIQYANKPRCNYCDACMGEYCSPTGASIKEEEPSCKNKAVIPSITVDSVDGITNLANCLVHVTSTNTTYYVDDKHRIMITWAGPVNIPGYDMEDNPNHYRNQIVTDTDSGMAVIYDDGGKGYIFGITDSNLQQAIDNKLNEMAEDGTLVDIINQYLGYNLAKYYNTTEDLLDETDFDFQNGQLVKVLGYHTIGDGGETYYQMSTSQPATGYYVTVNSQYYGVPLTNLGNTIVYGDGKDAFDYALANSNEVTMFDNLTLPANTYEIKKDMVLDMNGHKITMEANDLNYAWLIRCSSGKLVTIKNGELDGNYLAHTLSPGDVINHTGILVLNSKVKIENMNIHKFYYEGLILNSLTAKSQVEGCSFSDNGRNDIALLSWEWFTCNDTSFSGSIPAINPNDNIDCEPYEADSNMGPVEVYNCTFNSTDKTGFSTYLDVNQTKSATINVHNNVFYNGVKFGHDRGHRSSYRCVDNVFYNITGKPAIKITQSIDNVDVKAITQGCPNPVLVELEYTFSSMSNINIDVYSRDTGSLDKSVEITIPEGNLSYDYPLSNFYIKTNSNLISGWLNLHNSVIDAPSLTSVTSVTLDTDHYYKEIYLTGYGVYVDADALYQNKKWKTPSFSVITNNNNDGMNSSYLPQLTGIGNGGFRSTQNGCNVCITLHSHNRSTFVIDDLIGTIQARIV